MAAPNTFDVPDVDQLSGGKKYRVKLTVEERRRVEAMIRNAKSLADIARLEKDLNEGRVPGGVLPAADEVRGTTTNG